MAIDRLPGARVLVHCGPGDRDDARAIVHRAGHSAVQSLADEPKLPFGLSKAVLRRADVLVTSDSGPRHIAAAFGTPTVVLLGPMDPRLSRSDQRHLVEMRLDLPCSPCGRRVCPLQHHDCLRLLTVDDVGSTMLTLLEDAGSVSPGWNREPGPRVCLIRPFWRTFNVSVSGNARRHRPHSLLLGRPTAPCSTSAARRCSRISDPSCAWASPTS